jgi:hypothetical protein
MAEPGANWVKKSILKLALAGRGGGLGCYIAGEVSLNHAVSSPKGDEIEHNGGDHLVNIVPRLQKARDVPPEGTAENCGGQEHRQHNILRQG